MKDLVWTRDLCQRPWRLFSLVGSSDIQMLMDDGRSCIRQRSPQHPHAGVIHHHGEADHMAYLERPFHEACAALHRRMHELGIPH